MDNKITFGKENVNETLYNWTIQSQLLKIAFGIENIKDIDDSLHNFFFGEREEKVIAGSNLYRKLWEAHCQFGPHPLIKLLQECEYDNTFYKKYREHTKHPLYVCLLGLYIYEKNITIKNSFEEFVIKIKKDNSSLKYSTEDLFVFTWLLSSLYHDIGYLLENDKIKDPNSELYQKFMNEINKLLKTPLASTLSCKVTEGKEQKYINKHKIFRPNLISIDDIEAADNFTNLQKASEYSCLAPKDINGIKEYYDFAKTHNTTDVKRLPFRDHGISSALLLLLIWRSFKSYIKDISLTTELDHMYSDCEEYVSNLNKKLESFDQIVETASQAISLHNIDKNIWGNDIESSGIDFESFNINLKDNKNHCAMPIAFLLRLCDELQDWDRPRYGQPPDEKNDNLYSKNISIIVSNNGIFLRFFADEEELIHPDTYETGCFYKMKTKLIDYLNHDDVNLLIKYGKDDILKKSKSEINVKESLYKKSSDEKSIASTCCLNCNNENVSNETKLAKESAGVYSLKYNNGSLKLYFSKSSAKNILSPHSHDKVEEVSLITKGSVYVCIDNEIHILKEKDAKVLPTGKLHEFIPRTFPCEFIVIGYENNKLDNVYKTNFDNSLNELCELEKELKNNIIDEESSSMCEKIISYLESEIMDVRWRAVEILRNYIKLNKQGLNIDPSITNTVQTKLRSKKIEDQLIGIYIATEFNITISISMIYKIMTSRKHFMLPWTCAYYLLKDERNDNNDEHGIDFEKMFNMVNSSNDETFVYYNRVIIAILQLIKRNNPDLLNIVRKDTQPNGVIPIEEIILHFAIFDTHKQLPQGVINIKEVEKKLDEKLHTDGESILLGIMDFNNEDKRYETLEKCREDGKLLDVLIIYYSSIKRREEVQKESFLNIKEHIKNYLRIIVTDKCNLKCVYCHKEGRHKELNASSVSHNSDFNLRDVLEIAKESNIQKVKISGGEPLLNADSLIACIEYQKFFNDIGFTTNGTQLLKLEKFLAEPREKNLSFNVTVNTLNSEKYKIITASQENLEEVIEGIDLLIRLGYKKVKINSVITSYNFDEIENLVTFAARKRIKIKLLDLFSVNKLNDFQYINIAKIRQEIMEKFNLKEEDFLLEKDYLYAKVMGTEVLLPKRTYSLDCQYCPKYPCAEGLFGIRVYEDYSCSPCFKNGKLHPGTLKSLKENIELIRSEIENIRISY